ncbi:hypothetical protein FHG64_17920 [Antarcticibacterium flavum]|uniref:Uncharacterized protein n=1 Tax=Antarcticibacterium flavum TaxID=2058175 RepID=A0A5B7X8Y7_9FLAO|nr:MULTISPECIES: hypothetical protein [Antarcticibacterium]MCM4160900.1 hypothetical protein [Antarcticibacterium sp. W02-3]QCY71123.1 hypothetical protein FHG64_17920 [Antarcticibacterium flavum]
MKRTIIVITSAVITAILSYKIQSFEFILIVIILLSLIFLILAGIRNYFKRIRLGYIKVPVIIIGIGILGVVVSLFRPYENAVRDNGTVSDKLEYSYFTDQTDRKQLRSYFPILSELDQRDQVRMDQVIELHKQKNMVEPLDKFYAAFIYYHSDNSDDYKTASKLAAAAAKAPELKDHYQVQWLARASYDRSMLSIGKEEK